MGYWFVSISQPITLDLATSLHQHAAHRGAVLPADPLLRYRNGRPLTPRRYDHMWKRIGLRLPWAAAQCVSTTRAHPPRSDSRRTAAPAPAAAAMSRSPTPSPSRHHVRAMPTRPRRQHPNEHRHVGPRRPDRINTGALAHLEKTRPSPGHTRRSSEQPDPDRPTSAATQPHAHAGPGPATSPP